MTAAGDRLQVTGRRAARALPDVSHGYPFSPGLDMYKVAGKVFRQISSELSGAFSGSATPRPSTSKALSRVRSMAANIAERSCRKQTPVPAHPASVSLAQEH